MNFARQADCFDLNSLKSGLSVLLLKSKRFIRTALLFHIKRSLLDFLALTYSGLKLLRRHVFAPNVDSHSITKP